MATKLSRPASLFRRIRLAPPSRTSSVLPADPSRSTISSSSVLSTPVSVSLFSRVLASNCSGGFAGSLSCFCTAASDHPPETGKLPHHHVNPPESEIPDSATLQEQWTYATRMYSKWYANAWGTAILAGISFYALGWFIKGEDPLLSIRKSQDTNSLTGNLEGEGKRLGN